VTSLTAAERATSIDQVAAAPAQFRRAVMGLTPAQFDTPYREGGWTVRQVAHHVPDSHMNAYLRFKFGLTEDSPAIKTYEEKDWAKTPEVAATPVDVSLALLDALHARWVMLLRAMTPQQFARTIQHPEIGADEPRHDAGAVRVARPAQHGARDEPARTHGVAVAMVDFADDDLDEEFPLGDGSAETEATVMCPLLRRAERDRPRRGDGAAQDTWRTARSAAGPGGSRSTTMTPAARRSPPCPSTTSAPP